MQVKLKNLTVCENIIVSQDNNKMSLINIFSDLSAQSFPAITPKLAILVCVDEGVGEHEEVIEIINPNGKLIASTKGNINIPKDGVHNFIANFFNLHLSEEGKYWVKVSINGQVLTNKDKHFILVKKI